MTSTASLHQARNMLRCVFTLLFCVSSFLSACNPISAKDIQPGTAAPDFTLEAVQGGSYHLTDLAFTVSGVGPLEVREVT